MKTLTTLIAVAATSFALNANAFNVDELTIGEVFPIQSITYQQPVNSTSLPNEMVWSSEKESYFLISSQENSVAGALLELKNNPPAAGGYSKEVFIYNEMAGEYHLQ
ncbi:MAG: hypothetical protein IME94_01835 [Proteobacteria bacterium]|nr:hypothetical protein [Pseudomonadota bacterium]